MIAPVGTKGAECRKPCSGSTIPAAATVAGLFTWRDVAQEPLTEGRFGIHDLPGFDTLVFQSKPLARAAGR
jgi:hypothetical protein